MHLCIVLELVSCQGLEWKIRFEISKKSRKLNPKISTEEWKNPLKLI